MYVESSSPLKNSPRIQRRNVYIVLQYVEQTFAANMYARFVIEFTIQMLVRVRQMSIHIMFVYIHFRIV